MFSANENLQLRQHKRRIVQAVEATMDEDLLELGVNVMVMQVACQDPGCVPIETAIIIVFPSSSEELLPGLPQSAGGNYKTKILKPMAEVETPQDVLEALPPQFKGGLRTAGRLAVQLRDAVLAQIQQTAGGDDDVGLRRQLAEYLRGSLDEYVQHDCVPPPLQEPYPEATSQEDANKGTKDQSKDAFTSIPSKGNFVLKRPSNEEEEKDRASSASAANTTMSNTEASVSSQSTSTNTIMSRSRANVPQTNLSSTPMAVMASTTTTSFDSVSRRRQQAAATRNLLTAMSGVAAPPHARGVRRVGCPCCDPDNPSNVVDQMMQL